MSLRSLRALCLTSFFIADVRDGLGPFLGIFLTQRHWQAEDIGLLMTVGGVAGLLATLPAGFITDTSRHKRVLLAGVCLAITLTTLLLWFSQKTSVVALSQVASGICAAFVGPLIAGRYSFATAFGVLSVIALVALIVWWRSAPLLTNSVSPPIGESGQ